MKTVLGLAVIGHYPVLACAICRTILAEGLKIRDSRETDDMWRKHILSFHAGKEGVRIIGNIEITQATPKWLATAWAQSES